MLLSPPSGRGAGAVATPCVFMASEVVQVMRATWAGFRFRRSMAVVVAGALTFTAFTSTPLAHASSAPKQLAAPRQTDPNPWQTAHYVPQPRPWRPYVLAPSS